MSNSSCVAEPIGEAIGGLAAAEQAPPWPMSQPAAPEQDGGPARSSETDRLVMDAFLRARNRARGPLVALTDRMMMANVSASELLQSRDRRVLWGWARQAVKGCSGSSTNVVLSNGVSVAARCEHVVHQDRLLGAVLHLSLDDPKRFRTTLRAPAPSAAEAPVQLDPHLLTGWTQLTDAERTVAELVAQGLTNKQAAKRLLMSHYTVDYHLRSVYRKLGVSSRVEVARLIGEHYELLKAS